LVGFGTFEVFSERAWQAAKGGDSSLAYVQL